MDIKINFLAPIYVAMIHHKGAYDQLSNKFEQLFGWVESESVPITRTIGIYWDNPELVNARDLRSAACVEVPMNYLISGVNGISLEKGQIAGGNYATTTFVGPYHKLEKVWSELISEVEGAMGRVITDSPSFEVYVNDPSDTQESELITELYLQIQ
jgi:AraC family transcriptional regulator